VEAKIKVEKFLIKQGIRVGKAAIEFSGDSPLSGFHLVGFTICDDPEKGRYVMFPMAKTDFKEGNSRNFFFLRPSAPELLDKLQDAILKLYAEICDREFANRPVLKQAEVRV
jgi:hypothetical protein